MTGTPDSRCVIVGASHAGAQAAIRLRRLGWEGSITLVGDEPRLPYHRPPLSKDYLKGVKSIDNILLSPEAAYQKANVRMLLGKRVERIERESGRVEIASGEMEPDYVTWANSSTGFSLPGVVQ